MPPHPVIVGYELWTGVKAAYVIMSIPVHKQPDTTPAATTIIRSSGNQANFCVHTCIVCCIPLHLFNLEHLHNYIDEIIGIEIEITLFFPIKSSGTSENANRDLCS